jgi:hypothetical protein
VSTPPAIAPDDEQAEVRGAGIRVAQQDGLGMVRLDQRGCGRSTPRELHRAWPGSRLEVVEDEGHGGPTEMLIAQRAIDAFAARR